MSARRVRHLLVAVGAAAALTAPVLGPSIAQAKATMLPPSQQVLKVAISTEPPNLDFMEDTNTQGDSVEWNIYDSLARYNYTTHTLQPDLATSWKQVSPTKWDVFLRKGVQFQYGFGEMTANDVCFSVNYILKNHAAIDFLYAASGVTGCTVVNKFEVQYTLSAPNTAFLETALQGIGGMVLSEKAFKKEGLQQFARKPVGAGPFQLQSWTAGTNIVLVKDPTYWNAKAVHLTKVIITWEADPTVKAELLQKHQVDLVDTVNYNQVTSLRKSGIVVNTPFGWNWNFLSYGTDKGVFGKVLVRRAINLALDRQQIATGVYSGFAIPDYGPLPPGFTDSQEAHLAASLGFKPSGNLAEAKNLMAKAGYAHGFSATMYVDPLSDVQEEAVFVQSQLKALGITVTIKPMDVATFSQASVAVGNYILLDQITIMSPDPDSAIAWFWGKGGVLTHNYYNPQIQSLIKKGEHLPNGPARTADYAKLQKAMLLNSWYSYIVSRDEDRAMLPTVHGFDTTPQALDLSLEYVWLSK